MDITRIDESWKRIVDEETAKPYFRQLTAEVERERTEQIVYPTPENTFTALALTPLPSVRVVILGQDCYINENEAHGLAFSVPPGVKIPPSLRNIFKELQSDLKDKVKCRSGYGCLENWAKTQGVLLLNSVLTVRAKKSGSHAKFGWQTFTDALIKTVSTETKHTVFILWGKYAQEKMVLIDSTKHLILKAAHPSPLSAHTGFFGCNHFSAANKYLEEHGRGTVNWSCDEPAPS